MRLTKWAHACVVVEQDGTTLLIDPGVFEPDRARLLAEADAVLVTHSHFDHVDVDAVAGALRERTDLRLHGPQDVLDALRVAGVEPDRLVLVEGGETLDLGGVVVRTTGGAHAPIHDGIPVPHDVGYLIGDEVFHPGDSYRTPPFPVGTLLVPISGPWTKVGEAIDFIAAVAPRRAVGIHDLMLSELGRSSSAMFLGEDGLTGTPLLLPAAGETVEL